MCFSAFFCLFVSFFVQQITKVGEELGIVPVVIKGEELDQKGFGGKMSCNICKGIILYYECK